ncbi:hypothetical protein ACFQ51_05600 [Streptomyces kaempferi]
MRLSTRIALAVGVTVPVLVLATGWLLLRLVAADLHDQQDAHLRERATTVAKDARGLLRASAADRSAAVEQARQRRLFTSALDVGVRLIGPDETFTGGPQPDAGAPLPASAPVPVTLRADGHSWRILSTRVTGARPGVRGTLWLFASDTAADTQLRLVRRRVVSVALLAAPLSGLLAWSVAARASGRCAVCNAARAAWTRVPARPAWTTPRRVSPRSTISRTPCGPSWPATTNRPPERPRPWPPHAPSPPPPRTNCALR